MSSASASICDAGGGELCDTGGGERGETKEGGLGERCPKRSGGGSMEAELVVTLISVGRGATG
jgi:hypothetical protein